MERQRARGREIEGGRSKEEMDGVSRKNANFSLLVRSGGARGASRCCRAVFRKKFDARFHLGKNVELVVGSRSIEWK